MHSASASWDAHTFLRGCQNAGTWLCPAPAAWVCTHSSRQVSRCKDRLADWTALVASTLRLAASEKPACPVHALDGAKEFPMMPFPDGSRLLRAKDGGQPDRNAIFNALAHLAILKISPASCLEHRKLQMARHVLCFRPN